jgi:hypothetical protein
VLVDGAAVLGAVVVTAVALWIVERDVLGAAPPLRAMVLGVIPFSGRGPVHVLAVTLAAATLAVAVVTTVLIAGRVRGAVLAVVVAALLVTGYARARPVVDIGLDAWSAAAPLQHVTALPDGADVRVRVEPSGLTSRSAQRVRLMLYEFYRPANTFFLDGATPSGTSTPYVIAPLDDAELRDRDATLLWVDGRAGIALWREPQD